MTYLNTGTFSIYLLPSLINVFKKKKSAEVTNDESPKEIDENCALLGTAEDSAGASNSTEGTEIDPQLRPLTTRETAVLSSQFCVLWFLANLFSNASLSFTSVGSSTILTSTSSFFTLTVGALFGVETITTQKVQALINSIVGLSLITFWNNTDNDASADNSLEWLGNLMALASALIYGIYATLLKVRIGNYEGRVNMYVFFGFVGLFNILLLWPAVVIFDYTGIEHFELPQNGHVWFIIISNASISIISDFCWALAMLMTSPLVVTVGLSATIPLAIAGDMAINSRFGTPYYYIGATLMIISIFYINHLENKADEAETESSDDN